MPTMPTARQMFDAAFNCPRQPRSDAYKRGVLDCLETRERREKLPADDIRRLLGDTPCIYPAGSAEMDAFYAGVDEGHTIYNKALSARQKAEAGGETLNKAAP